MWRLLSADPMYEYHLIAFYYHWDRDVIQSIPVRERRKWVEYIIDHLKAIGVLKADDVT